jgi:hypothetical protein
MNSTRSRPTRCRAWRRGFRFASLPEIDEHFGCKPGYLGLINLRKPVRVVVDREVAVMHDWICGANEPDYHFTGVNWGRDLPEPDLVTICAMSSPATRRRTARACWRSSAASRWGMCSTSAPSTAAR